MFRVLPLFFLLLAVRPAPAMDPAQCRVVLSGLYYAGASFKRVDAIGFHGTSIEAIEYAIQHGKFAPGVQPENSTGLYFYPNLAHPTVQGLVKSKAIRLGENVVPGENSDPVKDAWDGAVLYANTIAQEHRLMKLLGLEFTPAASHAIHNYVMDRTDRDHVEALVKLGVDAGNLETAWAVAKEAKGVILMIGPEMAEKMTITNAAPNDDGLRIDTTQSGGVPVDLFKAIEPLGTEEDNWLRRVKNPEPAPPPAPARRPRRRAS